MQFYKLRVSEIIRETSKAISVKFFIPEDLKSTFIYKAGQYVTIQLTLDNNLVRRAYSISSNPTSGELQITIKATQNGYFSVFANNNLKVGDLLEVAKPQGNFIMDLQENKSYLGIASGSGITPLLSMIKTTLEATENSKFFLMYGNKSKSQTIFYNTLINLQDTYPNRLFISWFFTEEHAQGTHFGRIEKAKILFNLKNNWPNTQFHQAFLCGPEAMIEEAKEALKNYGINPNDILFELFTSNINTPAPVNEMQACKLTIILDDETTLVNMTGQQTVLEVALKHQLDAPYSCQGGICSSCMAKIKEGSAQMIKNTVLTDSEIASGYILTCQAQPTSDTLVVDFDDI